MHRLALPLLLLLAGCATIEAQHGDPRDYYVERRADAISNLHLSLQSVQVLQVVGLDTKQCEAAPLDCDAKVATATQLTPEQAIGTRAELNWLAAYQRDEPDEAANREQAFALAGAYLDTAQLAYAWLFLLDRPFAARAFEDRQGQIRDIYNFATQRAVNLLFHHTSNAERGAPMEVGHWHIEREITPLNAARRAGIEELVAASTLRFKGLRNTYRRDGFGAELVAVAAPQPDTRQRFSEIPYFATTVIIRFPGGATLDEALADKRARFAVYDPTETDSVELAGRSIPLAGHFTAPYGLWLARSDFDREALRTLLSGGQSQRAHIFMMQPYDPDKLTVVMIHGLASSPAAWLNLTNEVLGDEDLRRHYQIWQVSYPTNLPIPVNLYQIRSALDETLRSVDPSNCATATHEIVVVGHSMGGVIARLLVSKSSDTIWKIVQRADTSDDAEQDRLLHEQLDRYLSFDSEPAIGRAVFMASPHRGSPEASGWLGRIGGWFVSLPGDFIEQSGAILRETSRLLKPEFAEAASHGLTSVYTLSDKDPFLQAAATLPPTNSVPFHSIIGRESPEGAQEDSTDGFVPYRSAHLEGAESELVLASDHSVQERAQAILELRRILKLHETMLRGPRLAQTCTAPPESAAQ